MTTVAPTPGIALPVDLLRAEWAGVIRLAHAWSTTIFGAADGSEQRCSGRQRPARTITQTIGSNRGEDLPALQALLARMADGPFTAPLWSEHTALTEAAGASDTTLHCDTTDRMLFAGGRVAVATVDPGKQRQARFAIAVIASVAAESIELADTIGDDFPALARVIPLIDADPVASALAAIATSDAQRIALEIAERSSVAAASRLPAWAEAGSAPDGAQTHDGVLIFDIEAEAQQRRGGLLRDSAGRSIGAGATIEPLGDRARLRWIIGVNSHDRASARRLLAWHDGRRGRLLPFWFVAPTADYRLAPGVDAIGGASDGDELIVHPVRHAERFAALHDTLREHVGVVYHDDVFGRSRVIRRITSSEIIDSGPFEGFERLALDEDLPEIPVWAIERISTACLARFGRDELVEEWITSRHARSEVEVVELIGEREVAVEHVAACDEAHAGESCTPGEAHCVHAPPETCLDPPECCDGFGDPICYEEEGSVLVMMVTATRFMNWSFCNNIPGQTSQDTKSVSVESNPAGSTNCALTASVTSGSLAFQGPCTHCNTGEQDHWAFNQAGFGASRVSSSDTRLRVTFPSTFDPQQIIGDCASAGGSASRTGQSFTATCGGAGSADTVATITAMRTHACACPGQAAQQTFAGFDDLWDQHVKQHYEAVAAELGVEAAERAIASMLDEGVEPGGIEA